MILPSLTHDEYCTYSLYINIHLQFKTLTLLSGRPAGSFRIKVDIIMFNSDVCIIEVSQ